MRNTVALFVALLGILILPCHTNYAQIYKFQQYGIDKGICHHTIYSITQDKHGFIWFATGMGLCRYDGFNFETPENDLPLANVTTAFRDTTGNVWFGYNDGLVVKYDGYNFFPADTSQSNTSVNQIIQAPKGEILVVTQTEGITRITGQKVEYLSQGFEDKLIHSACFIDENRMFIGCQDGLYIYDYQKNRSNLDFNAAVDQLSGMTVQAIIPQKKSHNFWVATEDDGIFNISFTGSEYMVHKMDIPSLEDARVQSIYEDEQNSLWISTLGEGLFRVRYAPDLTIGKIFNYNSTNGLGTDFVKQVFFDNQQNLWVGTYGQGLACLTNLAISFFENTESIGNNATALLSVDDSEYWVAGIGVMMKITSKSEQKTVVLGRANGVPNDRITALHTDAKGDLWIGTEKSGLYKMVKDTHQVFLVYRSENSLSNAIQAITSLDGKIWYASRNGVIIVNTQTGAVEAKNTSEGLPHNNIRDIYKDRENIIWIATNSNSIVAVNEDKKYTLEGESEIEFSTVTSDNNGNFWAGTLGRGIYMFDIAHDTVYHFTTLDGLKSDFCYAMVVDDNDHLWAGHRLGMSRINTQRHTIMQFGHEVGITGDVNPNAMLVNNSGEMLVGLTDGVLVYNLVADKNQNQAPMLNLTDVMIGEKNYNPYQPVTLSYGRYKVQFDFIGLQFRNPGSVTYQYILEGYDSEWSAPSNAGFVTYPRLEDGDYKLWVKACNSDNCTEKTLLFSLKVRKPFWKSWWFTILVIGAVVGVVYVIIMVRERNHRIQQEYLERELAARTKEVREQKEEIENKNRDITDSINYAQRIQFSVLPSTSTLLEHCTEAFVFYRPRDIVSGDFYWFEYFPQTKNLLIVCADSTGHGVPGAFMSLIGTTLIKDIAIRPDVRSPLDILYRLDENIQSTLNQNRESEQANDGMDLSVCEINTETHQVKIASAMRPFVVYHDGAATSYKGSRSSIGGQVLENKSFEMVEMQLSPGDVIYLFTDGYADQFGGPGGKKFKMNRLQNVFNDIHNRNMDEQHRVIKENFDLWKGDIDQVDDVLLIGIRV